MNRVGGFAELAGPLVAEDVWRSLGKLTSLDDRKVMVGKAALRNVLVARGHLPIAPTCSANLPERVEVARDEGRA